MQRPAYTLHHILVLNQAHQISPHIVAFYKRHALNAKPCVQVEAYLVCHGGINEVTSSSDKVLHASVRDVLQVVIVTTHVRSDVVLLQKWLETLHKNVCWSMLSNRPYCRQTET